MPGFHMLLGKMVIVVRKRTDLTLAGAVTCHSMIHKEQDKSRSLCKSIKKKQQFVQFQYQSVNYRTLLSAVMWLRFRILIINKLLNLQTAPK